MQLHQRPGMYLNSLFQQINVDTDSSHSWSLCSPHNCSPTSSICTTAPNYNKLCLATTAYVYNLYTTWRAAVHSKPWVTGCWGWLQGFLDQWLSAKTNRQIQSSCTKCPRMIARYVQHMTLVKTTWVTRNVTLCFKELHPSVLLHYRHIPTKYLVIPWKFFLFSNKNKFICSSIIS